ncbi:MAG: hypothetical protein ACXAC2_18770, partial [Candidatus Kariarchaeaceae archaeon]
MAIFPFWKGKAPVAYYTRDSNSISGATIEGRSHSGSILPLGYLEYKENVMNEKYLSAELYEKLKEEFKDKDYQIFEGKSLLYKLVIDPNQDLTPKNWKDPTRGDYAFETDLMIMDGKTPMVVIELKYRRFTTHDIITYSSKAIKHKEIYPYLRYGLVVGNKEKIDMKFFTHNQGFDFALMMKDVKKDIRELF